MLRNADRGEGCHIFRGKVLRGCKIQRYYEGVGGGPSSQKKALRNT